MLMMILNKWIEPPIEGGNQEQYISTQFIHGNDNCENDKDTDNESEEITKY